MIRAVFDHELSEVEQALVHMHMAVDQALAQALRAFEQAQSRSARALIAGDIAINERRTEVEQAVLRLIARQQPLTRDLRQCIAAIAIAAELERIGDYAAGIAELALRDLVLHQAKPAMRLLATSARQLLSESITAVINRDPAADTRLAAADDELDALYHQLLTDCHQLISADQTQARQHLYVLFVAHNLERIADRAVSIAERAVWVATGQRRK
jgi:phosphate transport system protein